MIKYELDAQQSKDLEHAFLSHPPQDGHQQKYEVIQQKLAQTAKAIYLITAKCPEQTIALRKLQEANHWFNECIKKYER